MELENRYFLDEPLDAAQHENCVSAVASAEIYHAWDSKRQSIVFTPFFRWDQHDQERTHTDIRELFWQYVGNWYDVSFGLRKVFWGTTESQHLVDIINQTDLVENPDGEDKLGQPMLASTLLTRMGNIEIYFMPYFRERTFAGSEGRLRTVPRVDTDEAAQYESSARDKHIDLAARWSKTVSGWDIGVSYFTGTNREPDLVPAVNGSGESILLPYYGQIRQTGLDLQGVAGAWLWKLETVYRETVQEDYAASTIGFEYTFYNVIESQLDIGMIAEYMYDERDSSATTPFNDDVMLGVRLTPNDVQGTQLLLGVVLDRSTSARVSRLEASRRLTDHVKIYMEATLLSGIPAGEPYYQYRQDSFLEAGLKYFF